MLKEPRRIGAALVATVHGNGAQKGIHRLRGARRLSRCQFWQRLLRQRFQQRAQLFRRGADGRDLFITCIGSVLRTRTKHRGYAHIQYLEGIFPRKA